MSKGYAQMGGVEQAGLELSSEEDGKDQVCVLKHGNFLKKINYDI